MVRIPILLGGKPVSVKCPVSYFDMSTKLFGDLHSQWSGDLTIDELVKVFSILTGIDVKEYELSTDSKLVAHIVNFTKFVYNEDIEKQSTLPTHFMGVKIQGPNLGSLTLAQNLHARKCFQAKDLRTVIALMCAIYMQPLIDKKPFDFKRAQELRDEINEMPITQTYALGFFLFKRLGLYGKTQTNYWLQTWSTIVSFGKSVSQLAKQPSQNRLKLLKN